MNPEIIQHIHDLPIAPSLDVLGKWIHCRNARTATTSVGDGVLKERYIRCIGNRRGNQNWENVWNHIIVPKIDDAVIFTFVRNTWDRVASAFFHCRDSAISESNKIPKEYSFGEWVRGQLAPNWPDVNTHFASQYDSVYCNGEPIPGMFVGRFERVAEDWARLARMLEVMPVLPRLNGNPSRHYAEYYDADTRDIVGDLYRDEICAFGYTFGGCCAATQV